MSPNLCVALDCGPVQLYLEGLLHTVEANAHERRAAGRQHQSYSTRIWPLRTCAVTSYSISRMFALGIRIMRRNCSAPNSNLYSEFVQSVLSDPGASTRTRLPG